MSDLSCGDSGNIKDKMDHRSEKVLCRACHANTAVMVLALACASFFVAPLVRANSSPKRTCAKDGVTVRTNRKVVSFFPALVPTKDSK